MDSFLLGHAVQKNGPDLIRNLNQEQQQYPENVLHYLSNYKEKPPAFQDAELQEKICRFISKKADYLFLPPPDHDEKIKKSSVNEDIYAKMPPLETFMGISEAECRKNFFNSVEKHDIVVGVVNSVMESGLVITLLCMDNTKSRDIDELKISAFCPVKELPKLFPNQDAIEGFQVRDKVRAVVLNVNTETEKLIVSMVERSLPEDKSDTKLALINEEEFPVQFRRKLHIRGLTFDELLHSILGFNNNGNINCLLDLLGQQEDSSLMRGLHRLNIPEKDLAENLRKFQSQKMAHSSVAQGITYFKAGKEAEAIQCFNRALDIDKTNVEALVARGALYANNESFNRAIDDFEDALKANPNHVNARKYLHDTLLAFGKSNEDIEKYQEAEEQYTKAMSLDSNSVEAREALRFLHYKRSQKHKGTRRRSSSRNERNRSPDGFEQTAKTLKKLIKGEDKRHRKKRRMSSGSSSSSSASSSMRSPDEVIIRKDNYSKSRKRGSKSSDRNQRNLSPPMGHQSRQPVHKEEEIQPHHQYGVDLQSSFLSGGGATFSDIFRSSSQEGDSTQEHQITTHISTAPVQYSVDPYLYENRHNSWYGMHEMSQSHMYGYGQQFPEVDQGFPGPGSQQTYFPEKQVSDVLYRNSPRSKSRSRERKRSRSYRSRSSSLGRGFNQNIGKDRRVRNRSHSNGRGNILHKSRSRSRSPFDETSRNPGFSKRTSNDDFNESYSSRESGTRTRHLETSRKSQSHVSNRDSLSRSPSSFEDSRRLTSISHRNERHSDKAIMQNVYSSPRANFQNERKHYIEESPDRGRMKKRELPRKSPDSKPVYVGGQQDNNKFDPNDTLEKSTDLSKDIEQSKSKLEVKKQTDSASDKSKSKKKKKAKESKKKQKKNLISESQLDEENNANGKPFGMSSLGNEKKKVKSDQISIVSSSSDGRKLEDKGNIKKEETISELSQNADIRRVVPREDLDNKEVTRQPNETKKVLNKFINPLTKSKWDSPDEINNSPLIQRTFRINKDSLEDVNRRGLDSSTNVRNRRSNSREFEGIRIHITNDQYGKPADKMDNLGVVTMFHVNEQPREIKEQSENQLKSATTCISSSSKNIAESSTKDAKQLSSDAESKLPQKAAESKTKTYRKRHTSKASRSKSSSSSRSMSRGRWSRSPVHKRRSYSRSPPKKYSGSGFKTTRPIIKGRNKFTGSRSPSISPGRKYSGRLRSKTPDKRISYKTHYDKPRGRGRGRGRFRGINYRGKGSYKSDYYRPHSYKSQRSRSRGRSRSLSRRRSRSISRRRSHSRRKSSSPNSRGTNQRSGSRYNEKTYGSNTSKEASASNLDNKQLDELENFYNQLKENKKKQKETK